MEQGDHLLHPVQGLQSMDLTGRLERVAVLLGPPLVLQVMSAALQRHGVDRSRVPVARQDAGLAYPQEIDEVPLAH